MNDKYFLDTNILIYSFDPDAPEKQSIARGLIRDALEKQCGCISFQVIQEFINVALRKFTRPLSVEECQSYLDTFLQPLCEIFPNIGFYHQALEMYHRWRFSWYDSMIITASLQADCSILYTEDLQHQQSIQNVTIVNPF